MWPSYRATTWPHVSWYSWSTSRSSSGSISTESAVEPIRSQKRTVSWRRSARTSPSARPGRRRRSATDAPTVSGVAHWLQNRAVGGLAAPQESQVTESGVAHWKQTAHQRGCQLRIEGTASPPLPCELSHHDPVVRKRGWVSPGRRGGERCRRRVRCPSVRGNSAVTQRPRAAIALSRPEPTSSAAPRSPRRLGVCGSERVQFVRIRNAPRCVVWILGGHAPGREPGRKGCRSSSSPGQPDLGLVPVPVERRRGPRGEPGERLVSSGCEIMLASGNRFGYAARSPFGPVAVVCRVTRSGMPNQGPSTE